MKLSDLYRWNGTVDRLPFGIAGLVLLALKFNIDRAVARYVFGLPWSISEYLKPAVLGREDLAPGMSPLFYGVMVALALPFVWTGLALTTRRLRAAGLPLWLVALFFAPLLKYVFFALLLVLPTRSRKTEAKRTFLTSRQFLDRVIPRTTWGSATAAFAGSTALAFLAVSFGVRVLGDYGWSLFVGVPFSLGMVAVLIYGYHSPRGVTACIGVALAATALAGAGLLLFALEGILCILMAAPLAAALAVLGGTVAYVILRGTWWKDNSGRMLCTLLFLLPLVMSVEDLGRGVPPVYEVRSAVEIRATPAEVWRRVVSFSELPEPTEWLFRVGIAYPMRAEIHGHGVGAVRHCVFSTGAFVEPIRVWDEPRLLSFSVTENPAPMQEWTPYRAIHPPHLDGFLVSHAGQFRIISLHDGTTLLEGTTWYEHGLWPSAYWRLWSDFIIHRIHLRVLHHVKTLAEENAL